MEDPEFDSQNHKKEKNIYKQIVKEISNSETHLSGSLGTWL